MVEHFTEDKVGAHRVGIWVKKSTTWHYLADAPRPTLQFFHDEIHHDFVPLWVKKVYEAPNGHEETFGRHVIGLWIPNCKDPTLQEQLVSPLIADHLPEGWPPRLASLVYQVRTLAGPIHPDGRPGDYEPYDGYVISWMKAQVKAARERTEKQRQDDWENAQEAKRLKNLQDLKTKQEDRIQDDKAYWQRAARGEDMQVFHAQGAPKEESAAPAPPAPAEGASQ